MTDNHDLLDRVAAAEREIAVIRVRVDVLHGRFVEVGEMLKDLRSFQQRQGDQLTEHFIKEERDRIRLLAAALMTSLASLGALFTVLVEHVL